MSRGWRGFFAWPALAVGLWLAVGPASAAIAQPSTLDPPAFDLTVERGRVSLRIGDPVPLADVVSALARAIGASALIRRNPGEIGPLTFESLSPNEALRRLAGRSSLALVYDNGNGAISSIVLVARSGQGETAVTTAPAEPSEAAPPESARNRQSKALRRVVELSYRTDDKARTELLALANDAEPATRRAAISALASLGDPIATRAIDSKGLTDRDPSVRSQAARSLWQVLGRNAGPRLAAAAAIDPDPDVRTTIAELLRPAP